MYFVVIVFTIFNSFTEVEFKKNIYYYLKIPSHLFNLIRILISTQKCRSDRTDYYEVHLNYYRLALTIQGPQK